MKCHRSGHRPVARAARAFAALALLLGGAAVADEPKGVTSAAGSNALLATPTRVIAAPGSPLWQIHLGNELSAQIAHVGDPSYQTYPPGVAPGDFGTFLAVGDQLHAPDFANHGTTATGGLGPYTPFTPLSQSQVGGNGSEQNPYTVTTVVRVGNTGLEITQVDSYVGTFESYRTDITIRNTGSTAATGVLYRAMDCYLGASDSGYGLVSGDRIACRASPVSGAPDRIQQFIPLTGGSTHFEGGYNAVWQAIRTRLPFNNTCPGCNVLIDNGMGISWSVNIPPGGSTTRSHLTLLTTGDTSQCGPTTVTVGIAPLTAGQNQPFFFSGRASIQAPFGGVMSFVATGDNGSSVACSASMHDVSASCRHPLMPGIYQVVAHYSGDGFNPSGCSLPQTVAVVPGDPTDPVVIAALTNPSVVQQGRPVTLKGAVTSLGVVQGINGAGLLDGYVTFMLGDDIELGSAPVQDGEASFTTVFPGGQLPITARYSGNSQYIPDEDAIVVDVVVPADAIFYGGFNFGPLPY